MNRVLGRHRSTFLGTVFHVPEIHACSHVFACLTLSQTEKAMRLVTVIPIFLGPSKEPGTQQGTLGMVSWSS